MTHPAGEGSVWVTQQTRQRLRQRLEAWLDEVLAAPAPPAGLAGEVLAELEREGDEPAEADADHDLYSLWSATTVLAQEVKLQGRYFKQLQQTVEAGEGPGGTRAALDGLRGELGRLVGEQDRRAERRAWREALGLLVGLRDRLARAHTAADEQLRRARRRSWLGRLLRRRASPEPGVIEGYAMTLAWLEDALEQQGVQPVACAGQPFDPQTMVAVDTEEQAGLPEGTVVEVYLPGYLWKGEMLRAARVKVARVTRDTDERQTKEVRRGGWGEQTMEGER